VLFSDICIDSIGKPCGVVVVDGIPVKNKTKIDKNAIEKISVLDLYHSTFSNSKPILLISTKKIYKIKNVKK